MARPPSADSIIRNEKKANRVVETHADIATGMILPNNSGVADHPETKKNLVPYTGANADVDLGAYDLNTHALITNSFIGGNSNLLQFFAVENPPTINANSLQINLLRTGNSTGYFVPVAGNTIDLGSDDALTFHFWNKGFFKGDVLLNGGNLDLTAGDLTTTGDLEANDATLSGDLDIGGDITDVGNIFAGDTTTDTLWDFVVHSNSGPDAFRIQFREGGTTAVPQSGGYIEYNSLADTLNFGGIGFDQLDHEGFQIARNSGRVKFNGAVDISEIGDAGISDVELRLRGITNSATASRFVLSENSTQGGYLLYNGSANDFFIGTQSTSYYPAIRLDRGSTTVNCLGALNVATTATITGDLEADDATFTGDLNVSKKISSGTATLTASSDDYDVADINVLFITTAGGAVVLGGLKNGVDGQYLHIARKDATNDFTLEHLEGVGTQDIYMHEGTDETIDSWGGFTLVCDGSNWYDVSHAKYV